MCLVFTVHISIENDVYWMFEECRFKIIIMWRGNPSGFHEYFHSALSVTSWNGVKAQYDVNFPTYCYAFIKITMCFEKLEKSSLSRQSHIKQTITRDFFCFYIASVFPNDQLFFRSFKTHRAVPNKNNWFFSFCQYDSRFIHNVNCVTMLNIYVAWVSAQKLKPTLTSKKQI